MATDAPTGTPTNVEKPEDGSLAEQLGELFAEEEGTAPAEATPEAGKTPGTDGGAGASQAEGTESASSETPAEGTDDLPDRYFEVERGDLPAEEWSRVIDALKARDDKFGQFLRDRQSAPEAAPAADGEAAPEEPTALSDEDILKALGITAADDFGGENETAKVALPLVRAIEKLSSRIETMSEERELEQLDTFWTGELDRLEKQHGELPVDRTAVVEFAAANGIHDPEAVYWQIAGPARTQVEKLVADARKRLATQTPAATSKAKPTSTRPGGGQTEEIPTAQPTVKGAVKDVAAKLLADLGIGE